MHSLLAQTAAPQNAAPVSYASVNQLNSVLSQVQQTSQAILTDVGKLRVDRWKTDSANKHQMQADVQSIQRNLQSALPDIMNRLQASPEDLNTTFKLYRNLDALYDVFGPLVESSGAFGSKDDYQALSNDLQSLETSRRALAERLDALTNSKEAELNQLRTQVKELAAQASPSAPKKVIVDDTEEPKPAKKKAAKKSSKSATSTSSKTSPSGQTNGQSEQPQPQNQPQ